MKRFPDIIVISWQCDCNAYVSHSVDIANVEYMVVCRGCSRPYTLIVGDLDVPVSVIPPRASAPSQDEHTPRTPSGKEGNDK